MKQFFSKLIVLVILILFADSVLAAPNIVVLATGGTISASSESSTGSKYTASQLMAEQLTATVPNLSSIANILPEQFSQISSQDMNREIWLKLAKRVNQLLQRQDVDGIVITHGTDTMEETAYFLNLTVKSSKPVVLTGSMRPATSLSADGPLNLYNAVAVAADSKSANKGVLVAFNDYIYAARHVSKAHTTNAVGFKSDNFGPIGRVYYGNVKFYYKPLRLHTTKTVFDVSTLDKLPQVDILYGYADQSTDLTAYLIGNQEAQGIVFAGVGNGNIYKDSLELAKQAALAGRIIVKSSRIDRGNIVANAEVEDSKYGFITADNLSPQKARILLMLALTKTKEVNKIQELFDQY